MTSQARGLANLRVAQSEGSIDLGAPRLDPSGLRPCPRRSRGLHSRRGHSAIYTDRAGFSMSRRSRELHSRRRQSGTRTFFTASRAVVAGDKR